MSDNKPVVVYKAQGEYQAQVVRARLEMAGIPVMIQSEAGSVFPFTIDGIGEYRVAVPSEWEQSARDLLASPPEPPVEAG